MKRLLSVKPCLTALYAALSFFCFADGGVEIENALVKMAFDATGTVTSIRELAGGRELVKKPAPFVRLNTPDGRKIAPVSLVRDAQGSLSFSFDGGGVCVLAVEPFDGGWSFRVAELSGMAATRVCVGNFHPECNRYKGTMVNAYSDDKSLLCIRAYGIGESFGCAQGDVWCELVDAPFKDRLFGVVAGPRKAAHEALKAMTIAANVPHTDKGGAWALGAPDNRRSYLMAWGVGEAICDDYIELCRRGGFGTLHFDQFWRSYGHYEPRTDAFPNGMAGMKACVDKAHAAGLTCDFHSLTACLGFKDSWLTPECTDDVMVTAEYTLDRPLDATTNGTQLVIREKPYPQHDFVMTYFGNGNILKIGTELVQYTGLSSSEPWTFTGVTRGAFGTTVKPHAAGARVVYPRQRFNSLQVDADKPLADAMAAVQGDLFGVCGFDQIYLDGVDCIGNQSKADRFVRKIVNAALERGKKPLYEDSMWMASSWWFHSRIGANDHVCWGAKRSLDRRFADYMVKTRKANFLEPDMGWWGTLQDLGSRGTPYRLDDHEYFAAKCAGNDCAMSVLPDLSYPKRYKMPFNIIRSFTVMGWYERFRVARAFKEEAMERMRQPGDEFRLRQGEDGVWRLVPAVYDEHTVASADTSAWNVSSHEARKAALRVEALHVAEDYGSKTALTLLSPSHVQDLKRETASKAISVTAEAADDAEHGKVLRVAAVNNGASRRGSWARVFRVFPKTGYFDTGKRLAFGFWVKGDGSGALLNLQLEAPREYSGGRSEHYLKLDFTGWRYVEFNKRERDSARFFDYEWPYCQGMPVPYAVFRTDVRHVGAVNVYLNDLPAGGRAEIELSEVRMLDDMSDASIVESFVTVGGMEYKLPFRLRTREFAELDGGFWTHYNASGDPIERTRELREPYLSAGVNRVSFTGRTNRGRPARTKVTVASFGTVFPALKEDASSRTSDVLAYEAADCAFYAPSKGFAELPPLTCRPGETACVGFEVHGPIAPFTLSVGDSSRSFGFGLKSNQYLTCVDGCRWQLRERGEDAGVKRTGEIEPFPPVTGRVQVKVACDDPSNAAARIDLVKHYAADGH